jgi:cell division septum initiation protein DivIVA
MSSDQNVTVSIDERRVGKAAGNAVAGEVSELKGEIRQTTKAVNQLSNDVNELERQINEVERAKATAERRAIEDLKDRLKEQVEEKRREYERRISEVLNDYRGSIERLKDRFLGSISGHGDSFETVETEFSSVLKARSAVAERSEQLGEGASKTYGGRTNAVLDSRNAFFENIDGFLKDREETAATIDSLQTDVAGIDGAATVTVPFWVVGIETEAGEEIRALPVLGRGTPNESPDRANPYADYLRAHQTHGYTDMMDAVHSYVARDEVRDALASRDEGSYADPEFLKQEGVAKDRFVNALREHELGGATATTGPKGERAEPESEVSADD